MNKSVIKFSLNGKEREVDGAMTMTELLEHLEINAQSVAIGRNEEVLPRNQYDEVRLASGDRIDIVQFVQGG